LEFSTLKSFFTYLPLKQRGANRPPPIGKRVKRKRYISSRPPLKNILELFGALFNKTRLRRSWQGGM
jgi:hypothetical protein